MKCTCWPTPAAHPMQVFDAIAPAPGTGRLAVVSNLFQVFLGGPQSRSSLLSCTKQLAQPGWAWPLCFVGLRHPCASCTCLRTPSVHGI